MNFPRITNNNYRQALAKTPGLYLSEETTPLISIGYRGLDPGRVQFTQVLKDGIPIHADQFGYPEAYYSPPLDTVDRLEFLRGGAALLYGPQPGGALNYITHRPRIDRAFAFGSSTYFWQRQLFLELHLCGWNERPARLLRLLQSPAGRWLSRSEQRFHSRRRPPQTGARWQQRQPLDPELRRLRGGTRRTGWPDFRHRTGHGELQRKPRRDLALLRCLRVGAPFCLARLGTGFFRRDPADRDRLGRILFALQRPAARRRFRHTPDRARMRRPPASSTRNFTRKDSRPGCATTTNSGAAPTPSPAACRLITPIPRVRIAAA